MKKSKLGWMERDLNVEIFGFLVRIVKLLKIMKEMIYLIARYLNIDTEKLNVISIYTQGFCCQCSDEYRGGSERCSEYDDRFTPEEYKNEMNYHGSLSVGHCMAYDNLR